MFDWKATFIEKTILSDYIQNMFPCVLLNCNLAKLIAYFFFWLLATFVSFQ